MESSVYNRVNMDEDGDDMTNSAVDRILALSAQKQEIKASVSYLAAKLAPIVKEGEATLICFPRETESDLGSIAEKAVLRCGSQPVFWEKDLRWRELLRIALLSKASTIIGPPIVILGLSKLGDWSVDYLLGLQAAPTAHNAVRRRVLGLIRRRFLENGFTIPYPQMDVHTD